MRKHKEVKHICKNCRLYDGPTGTCCVRVLHEGKVIRDLPVNEEDLCFWEEIGLADHIKEIRFRKVANEDATERITMEYPEDLFDSTK